MRKYALIGNSDFKIERPGKVVQGFSWKNLQNWANLKDFDALVFDCKQIPKNLKWDDIYDHLDASVTWSILGHHGQIVFIGDPRLFIDGRPFLVWTGFSFEWNDEGGNSKQWVRSHGELTNYGSKVTSHSYTLKNCGLNRAFQIVELPKFAPPTYSRVLNVYNYLANREEKPIIFSVSPQILKDGGGISSQVFSEMYFFPEISGNDNEEAVRIVLNDLFNIELATPEPAWLDELYVVGQQDIENSISNLEIEKQEVQKRIETFQLDLKNRRRFLKLLYASGTELEVIVKECLEILGAKVHETTGSQEDGILEVILDGEKRYAVFEVKGLTKCSFGEKGLQQLIDWQFQSIDKLGVKAKGLFIGVADIGTAPSERKSPYSDNWLKKARMYEFASITGEQLFSMLNSQQEGNLNIQMFWRTVLESVGPVDLVDLKQEEIRSENHQNC